MRRLNIFVDETGELGYDEDSAILYGVSFTFHVQKDDIMPELKNLNNRLERIGYTNMIHMANLILRREEYKDFDIGIRKSIFNSIYQFSRKIPVKYKTIIIDKRYTNNVRTLKTRLTTEIKNMVNEHYDYFNKFNKIVLYYDNGQEPLGKILESIFSQFSGFEHRVDFDHKEKRLFQISDMLTFIDKYDYKYKNKIPFSKGEIYFFTINEIRKILKELNKKRF